jgi:hypothetical protein
MTWGNLAMAADSGFADPDEEDALLRPAWEDTPDETDADRGRPRRAASAAQTPGQPTGPDDLHALLMPLCVATDAMARLDARAGDVATIEALQGVTIAISQILMIGQSTEVRWPVGCSGQWPRVSLFDVTRVCPYPTRS